MEQSRNEEEGVEGARVEGYGSTERHAVASVPALSLEADRMGSQRLRTLREGRELWDEDSLQERMGRTDR